MKPPGIAIVANGGSVGLRVRHPTRTEDKVWEAVQEALCAGWTAQQFLTEVRQAWEYELAERAKADDALFAKAQR